MVQQQQQLQLPAQRDPTARLALFALGGAALWIAIVAPSVPAEPAFDLADPYQLLIVVVLGVGFIAAAAIGALRNRQRQQATQIAALQALFSEHQSMFPPIGNAQRFQVFKRDGYCCQLCGASAQDGAHLEVDHKLARSKGGTNSLDNLWTLCHRCNGGKSNKTL